MKKPAFVFVILLMIVCAPSSFGQKTDDKPNLSGTWLLEAMRMSGGLPTKPHSKLVDISDQLMIKQELAEITISQKFSFTIIKKDSGEKHTLLAFDTRATFFTDGRGETNKVEKEEVSQSVTKWKGRKLLISFYSAESPGSKKELIGQTEMELSKDGKTLTVTKKDFTEDEADVDPAFDPRNSTSVYKLSSN